MGKLIIDGNSVYEMDEDCLRRKGQEGDTGNMEDIEKTERSGKIGENNSSLRTIRKR